MSNLNMFTNEFTNAVLVELAKLETDDYITREKLVRRLGLDGNKDAPLAVSILMQEPAFVGYESVRSRGIRRRKADASSPVSSSGPLSEPAPQSQPEVTNSDDTAAA